MVTLNRESFKNVKLFVGMPCYGGKMCAMTTRCMLQLQQMSIMLNFPIQFDFILSESLIPRARNRIVYNFLKSGFTHLIFIDADIVFKGEDVLKLIYYNHDICVGAYPCKSLYWERIFKLKEAGHPHPEPASYHYAINYDRTKLDGKDTPNCVDVTYGATGFMMIKKEVLLKMQIQYPDLKYINDVPEGSTGKIDKIEIPCFFDSVIDPETKRYLSEDYYFCQLWLKMGGKIKCDYTCNLTHIGNYAFKGAIATQFNINPTPIKNDETVKDIDDDDILKKLEEIVES